MRDDETCTLRLEIYPLESQALVISQAGNGAAEVLRLCLVCLFCTFLMKWKKHPKALSLIAPMVRVFMFRLKH